jgi:protease I
MADTNRRLDGTKVAALFTDGVEQVEWTEPSKALKDAGADVTVVSIKSGNVKAWNLTEWGDEFPVDVTVDQVRPDDFDALLLPGGVMNPDNLRVNTQAVQFVRHFFESGKPVASICHGPWTLVEADVLRDRRLTSWPSLKTDIRNAGGTWTDEQVVNDRGLVTSRKPDDIPAFNQKMIEEFAEGQNRTHMQAAQQYQESTTQPG